MCSHFGENMLSCSPAHSEPPIWLVTLQSSLSPWRQTPRPLALPIFSHLAMAPSPPHWSANSFLSTTSSRKPSVNTSGGLRHPLSHQLPCTVLTALGTLDRMMFWVHLSPEGCEPFEGQGPCLTHSCILNHLGLAYSRHMGLQRCLCVLSGRYSAALGMVSRKGRRPPAPCAGGLPWRAFGDQEGGRGLLSSRRGGVCPWGICPCTPWHLCARSFLTVHGKYCSPPAAVFHFHQGQKKRKGLNVEIRKIFWCWSSLHSGLCHQGRRGRMTISSDFTRAEDLAHVEWCRSYEWPQKEETDSHSRSTCHVLDTVEALDLCWWDTCRVNSSPSYSHLMW